MSKAKTRLKRDYIPVYSANGQCCRSATPIQAQQLIERGSAVPMTSDMTGELPGWKTRTKYPVHAIKLTVPATRPEMACLITMGETIKNAGAMAFKGDRSKTARMTEEQRRSQAAMGRPEEDFAERTLEKIRLWPFIHDTLAVMVPARAY